MPLWVSGTPSAGTSQAQVAGAGGSPEEGCAHGPLPVNSESEAPGLPCHSQAAWLTGKSSGMGARNPGSWF